MNKPKIRFKGFEGEWKDSMLSDFSYSICSGRDTAHKGIYPLYGSTGIIGTTNKPSYNGAMLLVARVGANAGKLQIINEECGVSDNTLIIKPNGNISVSWLYYYLVHCNLNHLVYGSGQPLITGYMLKRIPILLGSKKECDEIASYFTSLDAQIAASTSRLSSLKQIKAASLLNMFPQKGEMVPRVRFKGFQGEWKERKLGEVFSERVENNINGQLLSVTLNKGIIRASENGKLDNSNSDKSKYKVVNINDIAYNSMRMWQGASGCSKYEGIVSPAYTVITPKENIDSSFFSYLFKTDIAINKFRLHSQGLTSDNWNLKYPAFSKIDVYCPLDISEQRAIASYFTALDAQITLHRERLEKLKQIKAACLEKMFA